LNTQRSWVFKALGDIRMAKKPRPKPKKVVKIAGIYGVASGEIKRKNRFCPKCCVGVFMANHANRIACGRCGYSEMKKPTS